jgi:hypothetical protein
VLETREKIDRAIELMKNLILKAKVVGEIGGPMAELGGHYAGQRGQPSRSAAPPSPESIMLIIT